MLPAACVPTLSPNMTPDRDLVFGAEVNEIYPHRNGFYPVKDLGHAVYHEA